MTNLILLIETGPKEMPNRILYRKDTKRYEVYGVKVTPKQQTIFPTLRGAVGLLNRRAYHTATPNDIEKAQKILQDHL